MGLEFRKTSGKIANGSKLIVPGQITTGVKVFPNTFSKKQRAPIDSNSQVEYPTPTPSITPTITPTPSITPTITPTPSITPTNTPTVTPTPTKTAVPSCDLSIELVPTTTPTPTNTPTPSNSF